MADNTPTTNPSSSSPERDEKIRKLVFELDDLPWEIWKKFEAAMLAAQRATAGLSYGEICDAQYEAQETVMREFGVKRPSRIVIRPAFTVVS